MTNWMTAAGIAFIAGGLATLISLRSVLFGGGKRRRDRRAEAAAPARRVEAAAPARRVEAAAPPRRDRAARRPERRPGERRAVEAARPVETRAAEPGGLALIGLSAEDDGDVIAEPGHQAEPMAVPLAAPVVDPLVDPLAEVVVDSFAAPIGQLPPEACEPEPIEAEHVAGRPAANDAYTLDIPPAPADSPDPAGVTADDEAARPIPVRRVDRSDRRHGDRVAGWIRPEYHDDPPQSPSGEYWTPVPMDDLEFDLAPDDPEPSAKGYGWPTQVERLPAVPDYEPATGFDLVAVPNEPTEAVPIRPPDQRVRLPPSWTGRNEKPADNRFLENEPGPGRRKNYDEADQRFRAPTGEPERRRPRPRPRPAPAPDNVYVSRHAAEPGGR